MMSEEFLNLAIVGPFPATIHACIMKSNIEWSILSKPPIHPRNRGCFANRSNPKDTICLVLIPQVRPAHKYPNSPWEMIHPPGGG
jgi:hypothetical protein